MYEVTNDASSAVQRELIIGRTARLLKIAAELQCSAFLHISSLQVLPSQATSVRQAQDAAKHPFAVLHDDADRARLAAEAVVDSAAQKLPNVVIARLGAVCAPAAPGSCAHVCGYALKNGNVPSCTLISACLSCFCSSLHSLRVG